ncbi:hypothetical protein GII30_11620 [Gordonia amarae]|uniref:Uncharacterized protein n=1 Tax=Gordonia amarae TaxID=36821 RepID=A0A857KX34_9ACTN|nr:hypothetical protein [Gordonia amarae]MCS3879033.1 hypothetical protein [Gordonia amarae]QHN17573.1 hypothetical protein GII35_11830 [Gordonia amarae]QHN22099.1 hypothetical protein GII34_11610 [Gordonia amarae]QHN30980.1 hypothetical protein GII32_11785 [Gordonia amarae]QHN39726.1 hypothetical protein GII30_11620 [Gordonia amarae]
MSQTDIAPDSAPAAEATVNSKVRVTLEDGQVVSGVIVEDFGGDCQINGVSGVFG